MAKKKNLALGKGAAALFGNLQGSNFEEKKEIIPKAIIEKKKELKEDSPFLIDADIIQLNPHQPRKIFKEKELQELTESIKENGLIQPLIVSKSDDGEGGFTLIAGERRLRACKKLKIKKIPVVIKRATEREKMVMAIIENVQRSDLNCVEEGLAYYKLMNEFNLTQEEVARKLGKERSTIANFLRILKLPREVISMLQKELLSFGHAKVLASQKDRDKVVVLANMAVTEQWSIRELEKALKKRSPSASDKTSIERNADSSWQQIKDNLERRTGFHFSIKGNDKGVGKILINFNNEAEFNDIYEYLIKSR
ncbi:MAG: ParB/RepB/Spo0J family partition protein [Bdellovibrionota bacterium]|nr:ParB/RepB/Spo0J family partition protein [Bdellovibrionota bacterium]